MNNNTLWYNQEAKYWTQALALGNGRLGAMVYGGAMKEKICLNDDTLWSGYPKDHNRKGSHIHFKKARDLALEDKLTEAGKLIWEECLSEFSEGYLPLGDINILFHHTSEPKNYKRSLDIENGVSEVMYEVDGVKFKRQYIISNVDDVLAVKFTADKKRSISFNLSFNSQIKNETFYSNDGVALEGICPSVCLPSYIKTENAVIYSGKDEEKGIQFKSVLKVEAEDGSVKYANNSVEVKNATSVIVYFSNMTSFNGFDKQPYLEGREYKDACANIIDKAQQKGYDKVFADHTADFSSLFNRVKLDLGTNGKESLPTDERLLNFKTDRHDLSLYTLLFNFGRYLIIAGSRKGTMATNLQGIWNNHLRAPWSSNFTININTQMNYWPVLMSNLVDCNLPIVELTKNVAKNGEKTAREHYDARGFVSHHNTDIWCMSTPVGKGARNSLGYAFWNMSGAWLARHVFEHYEYTQDVEFLKNEVYPLLKSAALFFLDTMVENRDGYLIVAPATSPENSFILNNEKQCLSQTTIMSTAIVKDLFVNCIKSCNVLNEDLDFKATLEKTMKKMVPLKIGSKGQLLEWDVEYEETDIHHRHVSHLYTLHPSTEITKETTPELFEACKKTLEIRGDDATGWGIAWRTLFWARLRDGNHVLKLLDRMLNVVKEDDGTMGLSGGTYINMFDAHPPFQIDGNYGVCAGIFEMLIQSNDNNILVLPALPDKWATGSLCGVLLKGNIVANLYWENNEVTKLELIPNNDVTANVIYKGQSKTVVLKKGEKQLVMGN